MPESLRSADGVEEEKDEGHHETGNKGLENYNVTNVCPRALELGKERGGIESCFRAFTPCLSEEVAEKTKTETANVAIKGGK